jgi:hypothetical protein
MLPLVRAGRRPLEKNSMLGEGHQRVRLESGGGSCRASRTMRTRALRRRQTRKSSGGAARRRRGGARNRRRRPRSTRCRRRRAPRRASCARATASRRPRSQESRWRAPGARARQRSLLLASREHVRRTTRAKKRRGKTREGLRDVTRGLRARIFQGESRWRVQGARVEQLTLPVRLRAHSVRRATRAKKKYDRAQAP